MTVCIRIVKKLLIVFSNLICTDISHLFVVWFSQTNKFLTYLRDGSVFPSLSLSLSECFDQNIISLSHNACISLILVFYATKGIVHNQPSKSSFVVKLKCWGYCMKLCTVLLQKRYSFVSIGYLMGTLSLFPCLYILILQFKFIKF